MICNNCGKEVGEATKFCYSCGSAVTGVTAGLSEDRKLRHGFTSFWLWLMLIFSGLVFIIFAILFGVNIFDPDLMQEIFGPGFTMFTSIWLMFSAGLMISGLWQVIKKWRRSGFYRYLLGSVVCAVFDFILTLEISGPSIFIILSIGITFAVLHIKNSYNALSTWEQMTGGVFYGLQ